VVDARDFVGALRPAECNALLRRSLAPESVERVVTAVMQAGPFREADLEHQDYVER
jgi:peptide methionine sulfoxide reductase MsrA